MRVFIISDTLSPLVVTEWPLSQQHLMTKPTNCLRELSEQNKNLVILLFGSHPIPLII